MLNTKLKYANVNHMANLFLFVFLLFSVTVLLQLGVYQLEYCSDNGGQKSLERL